MATKTDLIELVARALDVPDYFGANWDALDDCLRDLSWLKERVIVISHDGVPRLPAESLRTYLDVLTRAVESWHGEKDHAIIVAFPPDARNEIAAIAGRAAR